MNEVLVRRPDAADADWRKPDTTAVGTERELQNLIARSPRLVPGIADGPVASVRELHLSGAGFVDVVLVEGDGSLTIVECKLASNSEIRRAVVGQLFAYAASLWRTTYERFDAAYRSRTGESLVGSLAKDATDFDEEVFRQTLGKNLENGAFRLAFAVDEITSELKDTVLYLNRHTTEDLVVLALELRFAADGDVEILVSHTYGEESGREKTARLKITSITDYRELLSEQRYEIVRQLFEGILSAVEERKLPWTPTQLAKSWLLLSDSEGRPRIGIDFGNRWGVELWVRLPQDPEELRAAGDEIDDPYPYLSSRWRGRYHQWQWQVPVRDDVPDVGSVVDLAVRYEASSLPSK